MKNSIYLVLFIFLFIQFNNFTFQQKQSGLNWKQIERIYFKDKAYKHFSKQFEKLKQDEDYNEKLHLFQSRLPLRWG